MENSIWDAFNEKEHSLNTLIVEMGLLHRFGPASAIAADLQGLASELYPDMTLFLCQRGYFGPATVVLGADCLSCKEIFRAVG